ncbi:MAG: alanine/glycine:cation symporter family protein, partial [Verrucomicrobiota bacterium]
MFSKSRFRLCRLSWLTLFLSFCVVPIAGSAEGSEEPPGLDERIDGIVSPVSDVANKIIFFSFKIKDQGLPLVLILLGGTAVFLTIYFKFINLRAFGVALRTVRGRYTPADAPGQITHFQALTAALSATVGLGNIAGVAIAIGLGGPGATFWMILMGIFGMSTKFCECTLGVRYREIDSNGNVHGGAMYYLSKGLAEKGLGGLGAVLAGFFAVMTIGGAFGAGNMYQMNQSYAQFSETFGVLENQGWAFGLIVAVVVGFVIIGGIVWIARVTSFLVPFMCGIYLLAAFSIVVTNLSAVPAAFGVIVTSAFSPEAVGGGIIGVLIQGIKRAAFSNEAGLGSAPIAHSAVKTDKPASEGLVALLEPFVDTVVVCTMTALVIVITGTWKVNGEVGENGAVLVAGPAAAEVLQPLEAGQLLREIDNEEKEGVTWKKVRLLEEQAEVETDVEGWVKEDSVEGIGGIAVTSMAFERVFSWFPYLLSVAVLLFAFSTMISWSYYGEKGVAYIFGIENKIPVLIYKLFFCGFAVIGAAASLGSILALSDAMVFAMVFPNLIGLYFLLPVVKEELQKFMAFVK